MALYMVTVTMLILNNKNNEDLDLDCLERLLHQHIIHQVL